MRRRLLTSYLLLTLVVLVVLEVPLGVAYRSRERQQQATTAERDAYQIANYAEETLEGDAHADIAGYIRSFSQRTHAQVEVRDAAGRLLTSSGGPVRGPVTASEVPVVTGDRTLGRVRVVYGAEPVDDRIHAYWLLLALTGLGCLAAATLVGLLLSRWVTQPLVPMRDAARRLGGGDLSARVGPAQGPPELLEMAETFDEMADRLEELVGAQEAFVADASHQLRTPLTALRLRLENLEADVDRGGDQDRELAEDLAGARRETQRLSRLVDGLLTLAHADRGGDWAARQSVEVDLATAERAGVWQPIGEECDVQVVSEPSHLAIVASPDRLAQVLDNLLANAIDASPPYSRLRLWAEPTPDGRWVEVHVTDQGPGLDSDQRARAFDRFWRAPGNGSRSEPRTADGHGPGDDPGISTGLALGGSGLGLAIVARLVAADRGSAELRPASGHGLDAVVRYPATTR